MLTASRLFVFYNVIIATLALTVCYGAQCRVYEVKYYECRITEEKSMFNNYFIKCNSNASHLKIFKRAN